MSFKQLKEQFDALETVYKVASAIFTVVATASAWFVRSKTLAIIIAVAALVGGITGFAIATWRYLTSAPETKTKLFRWHILAATVAFFVLVMLLWIAEPGSASLSTMLASIREFLLTTMLLFNVVVAVLVVLIVHAVVVAIVIAAPQQPKS